MPKLWPPAPDSWFWKALDAHTWLLRETRGRFGGKLGRLRFLVLHHVGARTGTARALTLLYKPRGDELVIVGSKGGGARNPAWLYNLRAHPDTVVELPGSSRLVPVRAREVTGAERDALWTEMVAFYPPYASYQRKTERLIPIVVLSPRSSASAAVSP